MLTTNINAGDGQMEKRRINISSKRQITIPAKYFDSLGLDKELDCIYSKDMLILLPVKKEDPAFAEEILQDLIEQGFSGEKLLTEFKKANRKVRPAVEKLIEEADEIAKAASVNYIDPTDDIFGDEETEDATRLVKENGRSVASVAKDLGINPQTLRNWLGEDKKRQSPDKARIMELEAELRAEKRRNTDLEESVAILKKAAAIFATSNRK
jgi:transposase-like protein/bifunctional DNA-binding transcriptional regulator/antitoxin component of YhaV-PrlF toxin-antitoxin module